MANTIELIGGVGEATSRMYLKQEMERFGKVDVCHMGNRQNPKEEPPWIRFAEPSGAENALSAIKSNQVFLDGVLLQADYRSSRRAPEHPRRDHAGPSRRDLEVNSRDLFLEQERERLRGGGRDRDRRRSRSRRRRDSRERDRDRRRRRSRS
mmetsp:Transcript_92613/g.258888  ORF Transcript_92613/g.258888 Transcript_92613/m.258888 type:complete len:152 (+) Transcript_92613:68-523(+)